MQINMKKILVLSIVLLFCISSAGSSFYAYIITVNTNQPNYYPGETVTITGRLTQDGSGVPNSPVCVSIKDPSNNEVFSLCMQTNSQGQFSVSYQAKEPLGIYSVKAQSELYSVTAYDTFKVVSKSVNADANGPYYGAVGIPVQFEGSAVGGKTPYTWQWIFGEGTNTSDLQDPLYAYSSQGEFQVSFTVRDQGIYQGTDYTIAYITEELIADPQGPYYGTPEEPISFIGSASGGFSPYEWLWDFGDEQTSNEQNPLHQYLEIGLYTVTLTVKDNKDIEVSATTTVEIGNNSPPLKPNIYGITSGKAGKEYTYTADTTDPQGDQISYFFDWGDGTDSGWLGPFNSGEIASASHTWDEQGNYEIKVKSKDIYDAESPWSDPLAISMPKAKFFRDMLNRYPIFFKLILKIFSKI